LERLYSFFSSTEFKRQNDQQLHPMIASLRQTNDETKETIGTFGEIIIKLTAERDAASEREKQSSLATVEEQKRINHVNAELKLRKDEPDSFKYPFPFPFPLNSFYLQRRHADQRDVLSQQAKAKLSEMDVTLRSLDSEDRELRKKISVFKPPFFSPLTLLKLVIRG